MPKILQGCCHRFQNDRAGENAREISALSRQPDSDHKWRYQNTERSIVMEVKGEVPCSESARSPLMCEMLRWKYLE